MPGATPESTPPRILVVGGGHAGVEAALAAARLGASVTLITLDPTAIGRMSCNPSVGGLGKGQLVREVDTLGGLMGEAGDATATQFRMLNTSKGPAVQSPRAQVDHKAYADFVRRRVQSTPGVDVVTGQVASVLERSGRFLGFRLSDGRELTGAAGVLTTGTFLRGLMHVGDRRSAGGRVGEAPAAKLSASLSALGLSLVRLKTGTPPRVHKDSVDLTGLPEVWGAPGRQAFSFRIQPPSDRPSLPTVRTQTSPETHEIVRDSLHLSPYGRGALEGTGPRYCPSLEDKVVRFAEKTSHRVLIERETVDGVSLYLNGLSMCLPAEVQLRIVQSVPGLERARLLRPGYAVEYDAVPAFQLRPTLECRTVAGLFLAGQINGTSGYEEAAAQGLMAGLNATRVALGEAGVVLGRHQAYIGVLIDDLVTSSPREPYRMFTSRAEHRLLLRQDNADRRLMPLAHAWGLIDDITHARLRRKQARISAALDGLGHADTADRRRLRAGAAWRELPTAEAFPDLSPDEIEQVELDVRYEGYVKRQERMVERVAAMAAVPLPDGFDYLGMDALGMEARQVLDRLRPANLGQAARLAGVTRADLQLLALRTARPAPA